MMQLGIMVLQNHINMVWYLPYCIWIQRALRNVHFEVLVDHCAIVNCRVAEKEIPTRMISKLLECFSLFSFYLKFKRRRYKN